METTTATAAQTSATPVVMISPEGRSESLPEVQEFYNFKRSAKKFLSEATEQGWNLLSVERTGHADKMTFERWDGEEQDAASSPGSGRPLLTCTAHFGENGAYIGAQFTGIDGAWAGRRGDSLSDALSAIQQPNRNMARHAEKVQREGSNARKQENAAELKAAYLAEQSEERNWSRRRIVDFAEYTPQAVTCDDRLAVSDAGWFLRAASAEAVKMIRKALAAQALRMEGNPTHWDGETPSAPMSIEEATQRACRDAMSSMNKDVAEQLVEAISELDRF